MSTSENAFKYSLPVHVVYQRNNKLDGHWDIPRVSGNTITELKKNAGILAQAYAKELGIKFDSIKIRLGDSNNLVENFEELFFTA